MPPGAYNHKGMYYVMICKGGIFGVGNCQYSQPFVYILWLRAWSAGACHLLSGFHGIDFAWSNIRSPADILLAATWNKRFHKACRGISGGNACKGVEKCAALDDDGRTFSSLLWGGYSLGGDSISAIAAALWCLYIGSEGIIDPVLRQELQEKIATQREARRWKGNAKGVDLNRIFTEEALDQPESIVLRDLVNAVSPQLTINYHSTGQVIFYRQFFTALEYMSRRTGYPLVLETGKPVGSFGDYLTEQGKKWCTIETGAWEAPVGHMQIYAWWMRQKSLLPLVLASLLC